MKQRRSVSLRKVGSPQAWEIETQVSFTCTEIGMRGKGLPLLPLR